MIRICQFTKIMRSCDGCTKGYNSLYTIMMDNQNDQIRANLCKDCLKELQGEIEKIINKDEEER